MFHFHAIELKQSVVVARRQGHLFVVSMVEGVRPYQ